MQKITIFVDCKHNNKKIVIYVIFIYIPNQFRKDIQIKVADQISDALLDQFSHMMTNHVVQLSLL